MARKKTTLMIEEALYAALRMEAAKRRLSVSDVVAEASRAYLATPRKKTTLPSAKGCEVTIPLGMDLNRTTALLEYFDGLDMKAGKLPGQY